MLNNKNKKIDHLKGYSLNQVLEEIMENEYCEFFESFNLNYQWEECQDLQVADFDKTNIVSIDKYDTIQEVLENEELVHVTDEGEILSGDYDDYQEFKYTLGRQILKAAYNGENTLNLNEEKIRLAEETIEDTISYFSSY